jgi:branched-chain amino acid transport system substrate-binding protein
MKALPTNDPLFGEGHIEANGRKVHPAYLFQVKTPAESKSPWDYYKLLGVIPADRAFLPLEASTCQLLREK